MDTLGHGIYTPMDVSLLPPLHLIYAENPSDSGKVSLPYCFSLVGQFVHGLKHSIVMAGTQYSSPKVAQWRPAYNIINERSCKYRTRRKDGLT